ncbi:OmpA family protein [Pseudonocardia sp. CA-107938]|uniref:OmpA family protein n=1 Tax=Pseudonocardia sp. CA-107938 TaxID=3240021 RepID=UPI003D90E45F
MSESPGDRPASRKPAWLPLGAAALIVPTALAGITLAWPRPQIEAQLGQRATEALAAAGIPAGRVAFSGRDAVISGVPAALREKAQSTVEGATGVRIATFTEAGGGAGAVPFGLKETGDSIVLSGAVGSEDERKQLVSAAAAQAGGRSIEDQLTVQTGGALPDGVTPQSVTAVAGALAGANGEVTVSVSGRGLTISGAVPDQATKDAVAQRVAAALPGLAVDNQLTTAGGTAVSPAPAPAPAPAPSGDLDAAAKQQLQGRLAQLLATSPISFGPNSPQLTPQGGATVAKVLDLLKSAPGARIQIDGYVAAGPGDGRLTAQQLSDARAATVRDALVAGGVPADRITARGLGEGSSPAQTAAARRVEITVV